MKKIVTMILLMVGVLAMSGCKTDDPVEVDCTLNPEHEDCVNVDFCELNPDDPSCNMLYTFADSYQSLDIENDQVDDFQTVYSMMTALVDKASLLYDVANRDLFYNFYSEKSNSDFGLTKEQLLNYNYPNDVLLGGLEQLDFSITSEVAHFEINLEDEAFVEGELIESPITEDYTGRSSILVNEDGFQYMYEVEAVDAPGVILSYYEMTLVVTDTNRLIIELTDYTLTATEDFDFTYLIYDSEVGYVVKDLKYYDESLVFFENTVDLNEVTAELKEINLGGYRTYTYAFYDNEDETYYKKSNSQSQIGNYYEVNKIAFFDELHQMMSLTEYSELVTDTYVPNNYHISYNISYLSDWDIVYDDYIIKNNSELAYVSQGEIDSIAHTYMETALDYNDLPSETEFTTPFSGLSFTDVLYSSLISQLSEVTTMTNPVFYDENIATVKGESYDIRTDLLELFVSDLPQIVYTNIMEHMILDDISFGGEDALIDMIDCDETPDHHLCPSP